LAVNVIRELKVDHVGPCVALLRKPRVSPFSFSIDHANEYTFLRHTCVMIYHCVLPEACIPRLGSRGVRALDTMKPVTAPIAITGKRSVCPPMSPSKRHMVKGRGKAAHATPAMPAVTPTPCGMKGRIFDKPNPSVPPMNSKGKTGPPSKPVANDVLVSKAY
jgi:hypothetical protein